MNHFKFHKCLFIILSALYVSSPVYSEAAQAIIIDHTCTDITKIPDSWINQVKSALKIHYAHTSHGEQPLVGCSRLMAGNAKYNYYPDNCAVPVTTTHMSLMDGQYYDSYCETYVTPELYWEGALGLTMTRSVLNSFDVNISMWAWCSQLDYYTRAEVQGYLNNMAQLESEFPGVTFVYMTGNAQSEGGQNRYDRNNQIREFCRQNNKILFDFADLDCWYNGVQYAVSGIPSEHPRYSGDEAGHTTYESCENKGRAFWWLMARIAGWGGVNVTSPAAPDIKANGSDSAITVSSGSPVSITIALDPGDEAGQNADWWIVAHTPFDTPSDWYHYSLDGGWLPGLSITYQGPLFSFGSFEVLNTNTLPVGVYVFYFGFDLIMNGTLDMAHVAYDDVEVDLTDIPLTLSGVSYWAYQIQNISAAGAVDALAGSHYDMLVLEPTRTDWSSDDKLFDTKRMVQQLRNTKASDGVHRKLIIAYIDIGQAEDWRWYWTWSKEWAPGDPLPSDWPDYILTHDPDGWGGNYPVAYWDTRWKDIVIYGKNQDSSPHGNYNSVIDEVIKDGFDGVYLDWVEGFENSAVIAKARAEGKDPELEMINFIQEMRDYAVQRNPNFLIIQQNAAALEDGHPGIFTTVDAIAQEGIWYEGVATDDWNDPDGYDDPVPPSWTSEYIGRLNNYLSNGVPVFNVEYALTKSADAYTKSNDKGYIPYCTRRSLGALTTTHPPGY